MMINFMNIKRVYLLNNILPQTQSWLNEMGKNNNESFVLWSGNFKTENTFIVSTVIYPEQKAFRSRSGIGVYVSGDELFKISKWLYDNNQVLLSQVHSHPSEAYHSDTDDNFPLVTAIGQFSVVVPYFARASLNDLQKCAVYRLNSNNKWMQLDKLTIERIFKVVKENVFS